MKNTVFAVNGSPHPSGNTARALEIVRAELALHEVEMEIMTLGTGIIRGCTGCYHCARTKDSRCVFGDDGVNEGIRRMSEADGILLASPVHYCGISGTMKSFLDRVFYASSQGPSPLRHKVGAAFVCVRRAGGIPAWQALNHYLTYCEMVLATGTYWPVVFGARPGEAERDTEGVSVLREIARNMAWLIRAAKENKEAAPAWERKKSMNFIRD